MRFLSFLEYFLKLKSFSMSETRNYFFFCIGVEKKHVTYEISEAMAQLNYCIAKVDSNNS